MISATGRPAVVMALLYRSIDDECELVEPVAY